MDERYGRKRTTNNQIFTNKPDYVKIDRSGTANKKTKKTIFFDFATITNQKIVTVIRPALFYHLVMSSEFQLSDFGTTDDYYEILH